MTGAGFDGAGFKTARVAAQFSQRGLAERAKVSVTTIKNIEANRYCPHWATAERLAEALGLCVVYRDGQPAALASRTAVPQDAA